MITEWDSNPFRNGDIQTRQHESLFVSVLAITLGSLRGCRVVSRSYGERTLP